MYAVTTPYTTGSIQVEGKDRCMDTFSDGAYLIIIIIGLIIIMKKALGETQTLRAGCNKAEPKKIRPATDPFPGAQDGQNLVNWRWSLPSPTDPVWWGSMHAVSSYRGNRPTKPQTYIKNRQDRLQYSAPLANAKCNKKMILLSTMAMCCRVISPF